MPPSLIRSVSPSLVRAHVTGLGTGRLPWSPEEPTVPVDDTPLIIFPAASLLWLRFLGGAHLRDAGGAVPDDAEVAITAVDLGNVGNAVNAGPGVTYSAAAFGGRGGVSFAGGATDHFVSALMTFAARCSGGAIWRPSAGTRGLFGIGAASSHTSLFRTDANSSLRRQDGSGGKDTVLVPTISTTADHVTTWRAQDAGAYWNDSVSGSASSAVAATLPPATPAAVYVGTYAPGVAPYAGLIGEIVLVDAVSTPQQDARLAAYLAAQIT